MRRTIASLVAVTTVTSVTVAALAVAGASAARAQTGASIRLGFGIGNDFAVAGRTTHLEGFEVGGDLPLVRQGTGAALVTFSPTITFGGSNRSGADADGLIYRLMVVTREPLHKGPFYTGIGIGYTGTQARGSQFNNVSGFASQYLFGMRMSTGSRLQPFAEVSYFDGVDNKVREWSFNLGARF